jgi:hypothetical protein
VACLASLAFTLPFHLPKSWNFIASFKSITCVIIYQKLPGYTHPMTTKSHTHATCLKTNYEILLTTKHPLPSVSFDEPTSFTKHPHATCQK